MRTPLYNRNAGRKMVGVTVNADLLARSAAHGIDISRAVETALIGSFETAEKEKIREEMTAEAVWVADFVAKHGYPFPEAMAMFMPEDDDPDAAADDAA